MKTQNDNWNLVYKVGGWSILFASIIFRRNWSAELDVSSGFGGLFYLPDLRPVTALDWFTLLRDHPFVGLSLLNIFDLINFALVGLFFLALYGAFRKDHWSSTLIATSSGLVGVAVYLSNNKALEMLSLSKQYFSTGSEALQATLKTAGDIILATTYPDPPYQPIGLHIGLLLVVVAGLIFSGVMLKSEIFGKATAICGILANSLALTGFLAFAFAPDWYWLFPTASAPFRMIWYIVSGAKLLRLSGKEVKLYQN